MKTKIAINGFGRIGRLAFRQLFEMPEFDIVAVNDPGTVQQAAYLLKYDTAQGKYKTDSITCDENHLFVDGKKIAYFRETDPAKLPWEKCGAQLIAECSGAYRSREASQAHLDAGASRVIISAPAGDDVPAIVYGINEKELDPAEKIISAASCSTNALAPMVRILHDCAPVQSGMMLVVHGYTATQMLQDSPQKKGDLRRSRAAAENIIPTTAEAAKAVGRVIPELRGKLTGSAVRVPVPAGCLITLTSVVSGENLTADSLNDAMKQARSEIFGYAEDEYVSSDIVGNTYASIFDPSQTLVLPLGGGLFQVRTAAWFDNENSFASQMVRLIRHVAAK